MTDEDYATIAEAQSLINAITESLNPKSPFYKEHFAIECIKHKDLALQFICIMKQSDPLTIAKMSFNMGVYLGIQHRKLKEMENKL
jgi:hypothetical protein